MAQTILPIEPFLEWMEGRLKHYSCIESFAEALGTTERTIYRLREQETISEGLADRLITREGGFALIEIYPELYETTTI